LQVRKNLFDHLRRPLAAEPTADTGAPLRPAKRKHRQFPSWIEQMEALAEQLAMAVERAERAERESAYFASMMDEVAKAAKMSDDDVSAICKRVRASHEAADEED
jgi:uncharacterized protein (UPF0335 family)